MAELPQVYTPRMPRISLWRRWQLRRGPGKAVTALVSHPQPQAIGSYARGRQLMAGNVLFSGELVEAPRTSLWDITPPSKRFSRALHRFAWIDDLAAVGDASAFALAQDWTLSWVARFGTGKGQGWEPSVTGRRLIHILSHAPLLMRGLDKGAQDMLIRSLGRQSGQLARSWSRAERGLPRVEALTGLIYAGLSLEGQTHLRRRAADALAECVTADIDNEGGLPNRNPEDLLEVFTLIGWVLTALRDVDEELPDPLWAAMERIAPTLRALRHVDGGLARFHGGGRGTAGQLDKALVTSELRAPATSGQAMGFATLCHGRTSVIVDAAAPPKGSFSGKAHASTLAFELTSGGHPLIVNCGAGTRFGEAWAQACRATASHSTLSLERYSSSRIGPAVEVKGQSLNPIVQAPRRVFQQKSGNRRGTALMLSHDGYAKGHGLTHLRRLLLSVDGRSLSGEDAVRALSRTDKETFDRAFDGSALQGIPYQVRFHLHPDVDASIDLGGRAVSLTLRNGEVWVFRTDHPAPLSLEPSVYMDPSRLKPRATKQIVLSDKAMGYAQTVDWRLTKAQEATALPPSFADRRLEPKT